MIKEIVIYTVDESGTGYQIRYPQVVEDEDEEEDEEVLIYSNGDVDVARSPRDLNEDALEYILDNMPF